MEENLNQQKNGTVEIKVTCTAQEVATAKIKVLKDWGRHLQIKGFRKGKAPIKLVEKHIQSRVLVEKILDLLVSKAYREALEKHRLRPITNPTVTLPELKDKPGEVSLDQVLWPKMENEGLVFIIKTYVSPEINLGNWKKAVRNLATKPKIETATSLQEAQKKAATKNKENPTHPGQTREDDLLEKIFDTLLDEARVELPQELIENEVNHQLYHQAQAVAKLGISLEDYLKSRGDRLDDYRDRLRIGAERNLKLRFILPEIAKELGIDPHREGSAQEVIEKLKTLSR